MAPRRQAQAPYHYRMCGAVVSSDTPLPELLPASEGVAHDVRVRWREPRSFAEHPFHTPAVDAGPSPDQFFGLTRSQDGFVLWFCDIGAFEVSLDGTAVEATPVPAADDRSITHVLVDHVLPRALARQGCLMLHGSAVELDGRAVAFVGDTGQGKSTLAAAFTQAGERLLSDDCLLVYEDEPLRALGSYPGLRLWPDHAVHVAPDPAAMSAVAGYTEKKRYAVPLPTGGHDALPLACWYVLADASEEIAIEPLSRRDALLAAVSATFRLDLGSREDHEAELSRLLASPLLLRARSLAYPRTLDMLPKVLDAIRADIASSPLG